MRNWSAEEGGCHPDRHEHGDAGADAVAANNPQYADAIGELVDLWAAALFPMTPAPVTP
jgi:hypothetical protein